jgi:hypothetical protein
VIIAWAALGVGERRAVAFRAEMRLGTKRPRLAAASEQRSFRQDVTDGKLENQSGIATIV